MMNSSRSLVSLVVFGFVLAILSHEAAAGGEDGHAKGIAWLIQGQNGDGSWGTGGARVAATAEVLDALRHSGANHGFSYSRGLSWLANVKTDSVDALARKIIALEQAGIDTQALGLVDELLHRRNPSKVWGAFGGYQEGFPDTALAMEAIQVAGISYAGSDVEAYFSIAFSAQRPGDSGWPYMGGSLGLGQEPQIMPTAYNLLTLSQYRQAGWSIASNIERAGRWLLNAKRQPDGSFLDEPGIAEGVVHKTALAYLAIAATGEAGIALEDAPSALSGAQTFLLAQQAPDGSWRSDPYQTALALRTLPALEMADGDRDGIPDAVEAILGTNPATPDERGLVAGNGISTKELSAPVILLEALEGAAFALNPSVSGGVPPYEWTVASGKLPPGLTHLANGYINGTPSRAGIFQFALSVSDSAGSRALVPGRIQVVAPDDPATDTDRDGLPSSYELANSLSPLSEADAEADYDGDGLSSSAEYFQGTDPNNPDSDADGIRDGQELAYGLDPLDGADADLDPDSDGLTNLAEIERGTDMYLADSDGDGLTDGEEVSLGRNPLVDEVAALTPILALLLDEDPDTDGDGLTDNEELAMGRNPYVDEAAVLVPVVQLLLED